MLIPEGIVEFFAMRPIWAHASTRSADGAPAVHYAHGFHCDREKGTIDALVVDLKGAKLREHLANNGALTFNITQLPSHKSYQLKGRGEILGPADAASRGWQKKWADENRPEVLKLGIPQGFIDMMDHLTAAPATLVRLHVEQIFDQMPGPGAGKKVEA